MDKVQFTQKGHMKKRTFLEPNSRTRARGHIRKRAETGGPNSRKLAREGPCSAGPENAPIDTRGHTRKRTFLEAGMSGRIRKYACLRRGDGRTRKCASLHSGPHNETNFAGWGGKTDEPENAPIYTRGHTRKRFSGRRNSWPRTAPRFDRQAR